MTSKTAINLTLVYTDHDLKLELLVMKLNLATTTHKRRLQNICNRTNEIHINGFQY